MIIIIIIIIIIIEIIHNVYSTQKEIK